MLHAAKTEADWKGVSAQLCPSVGRERVGASDAEKATENILPVGDEIQISLDSV